MTLTSNTCMRNLRPVGHLLLLSKINPACHWIFPLHINTARRILEGALFWLVVYIKLLYSTFYKECLKYHNKHTSSYPTSTLKTYVVNQYQRPNTQRGNSKKEQDNQRAQKSATTKVAMDWLYSKTERHRGI